MASGRQRGAFSVLIEPKLPKAVAMEDRPIERHEQRVDKPNPNAPAELSRFAFLIGRWQFEAKLKSVNGEWQTIGSGTWFGHFILDGYAIADEYRMIGSSGELIVLGINFRAYDSAKQVWNIKWLNALAGTRTELTSKHFGGARFDGESVTYVFKEPVTPPPAPELRKKYPTARWPCMRATYTNISKTHFTWRAGQNKPMFKGLCRIGNDKPQGPVSWSRVDHEIPCPTPTFENLPVFNQGGVRKGALLLGKVIYMLLQRWACSAANRMVGRAGNRRGWSFAAAIKTNPPAMHTFLKKLIS